MADLRSSLPKLITECLLIVFSVLLALGIDEWREGRQTEHRIEQALGSFAREIERNRNTVQKVSPYHVWLQQRLLEIAQTPQLNLSDLQRMKGFEGFRGVELETSSWSTATATGALADMDYETATLLSRIYTRQEDFAARQKSIFTVLQPTALTEETLPITLQILAAYLQDVIIGEKGLLTAYDAAEKHLKDRSRRR
jgi:hypothetical protein